MKEEIYGVITFKSTHHTIQAEDFLKDKGLSFKTVPTPREITKSCGLAILFSLTDLNIVEEVIDEKSITIDSVYRYTKSKTKRSAEKII